MLWSTAVGRPRILTCWPTCLSDRSATHCKASSLWLVMSPQFVLCRPFGKLLNISAEDIVKGRAGENLGVLGESCPEIRGTGRELGLFRPIDRGCTSEENLQRGGVVIVGAQIGHLVDHRLIDPEPGEQDRRQPGDVAVLVHDRRGPVGLVPVLFGKLGEELPDLPDDPREKVFQIVRSGLRRSGRLRCVVVKVHTSMIVPPASQTYTLSNLDNCT